MITTGLENQLTFTVGPDMTATALKSGTLPVLATPVMIAFMEACCMDCATAYLPPEQTTVGTHVDVSHEAPTPVGTEISVRCVLAEIDRRRLVFNVAAQTAHGIIGRGTHERFIIDREKFMAKLHDTYK